MKEASDTSPIAFRLGQVDALAKTLLASPALYSAEMRASLALHWLSRAWQQYREDRAITLGPALIGAECAAERNAFLTLFEQALPPREKHLCLAIRTVRKVAIRPMASEIADAEAIVIASNDELDRVLSALAQPKLSNAPLERLLALVDGFRYSTGDDPDPLSATARTPCWAINLAAAARGDLFHLSETALPFPGLAQRRLFRADRGAQDRRSDARESLLEALHATACDIVRLPRAAEVFVREFPKQRTNSRLYLAWMLLFGLGGLTPAQLARALPATKAGAGKLLRQLETRHLARDQGPFAPFLCTLNIPVAMPDWRYPSPD
ncbi:hypothetical protein [Novosphingobium colocasiae]|uniref:hypothetical protein n=1 Tax=Novosphingobium colocasiae TaxID=1256513 RepID=UPI0035B25320